MSSQVELHDCKPACPLVQSTSDLVGIDGIGRRAFLTQGALAAIALALAACGGDADGPAAPIADSPNTIRLADHAALGTVGGVAYVTLGAVSLAVVRTGESSFIALSRACPHQGALVDATATGFTCPRHGAQFSTTGEWVGGRSTTSLASYPVQYDPRKGTLTVQL